MDTVLFNFHDLVLILTAFECLLAAVLLGLNFRNLSTSTYFFIGFLLCHTLIPLHELIFWGKEFRLWMLDISPNLFFFGSYSYFLDGPLLLLFVHSLLYKDFALKSRHLLHLIPFGLYFVLLIINFYSLDYASRHQLIESQHIAYSSPFLYFEAFSKFMRVGYALACLSLILHFNRRLQDTTANINNHDMAWLKIMIVSLLALYSWDALLLSVKLQGLIENNFNMDLLNDIGVAAYHLNFVVINVLVILKFTRWQSLEAVDEEPETTIANDQGIDPELIEKINQGMKNPDIYALPNITLDKLASALDIPARKLSQILKQHYNQNFYEFVNTHRILQAKKLLVDPAYKDKTITDIYYEVGFNSKSVFNTFFKRMVNQTPSQYRQQHALSLIHI